MAYNTVSIIKDVDGKPIPQYYNALQNAYEVLQGRNGANRVELYDANGNPVDLAALIASIVTALSQVKIASSVLPNGAATSAKQDVIKDAIDVIETVVTAIRDKDLRGKAADKPAANEVAIGTTYWSVDTDPHANAIEVSTGSEWVVI